MIDPNITAQNNPRKIAYIVVHCTATSPSTKVKNIQRYWSENLGWKNPGYHYIIEANGNIVTLLSETKSSNGVQGYNSTSVHICYIGGVDSKILPMDTRTEAQKAALLSSLEILKKKYPTAVIWGHRDFPGVKKSCPSFDAKKTYANIK